MRTVIIADCSLAAEMLRQALRYGREFHIAGYVDGRVPCGHVIAETDPGMVVVEERDHADWTLERIKEVRGVLPDVKMIVLTRDMRPAHLDEITSAGADAVVNRQVDGATLGILIGHVARGTVYHAFDPPAPARPSSAEVASQLTVRELEILRCVASGATNGQIARQLWVTEQTVKFHLSNTYRKLGVANRTEASHYAHTHGLLEVAPVGSPRLGLATTQAAA
jgi:DNA-binding NarL/FixJ family response regulator